MSVSEPTELTATSGDQAASPTEHSISTPQSSYFAAADLGASSGRVILGTLTNGVMKLSEVTRFPNGPTEREDGIHWDAQQIFESIKTGINNAIEQSNGELLSAGVDTWGVDYGRLNRQDQLLEEPYHYRHERTQNTAAEYFQEMSAQDLYSISGLQVQPFNTIFQLVAGSKDTKWDQTETILFTPDLLTFWLTGRKVAEVTIASTSGLLDVKNRQWSDELCAHLKDTYGLPVPEILAELVEPGTIVGPSLPGLFSKEVEVVAVGSHDTASAVVAVPAQTDNFAFISSGTWSLVGLELKEPVLTNESREANLTNELGADGTVRYLQNVMGLWVFNECRRIWMEQGIETTVPELIEAAQALPALQCVVNINDERLFPPGDMPKRLQEIAAETGQHLPASPEAVTRCIMDSLALAYREAIHVEQKQAKDKKVDVVHIVGGGSQNRMLCQLTSEATGLPVIAGPTEGTALGSLLIQARACGVVSGDLAALREISRNSVELEEYTPGTLDLPQKVWDEALARTKRINIPLQGESIPMPIVNTHVHFPPNFSAYAKVDQAIQAGVAQQVAAMGISNFYDQSVYRLFGQAATAAGITPLYGLEFITVIESLKDQGVRINDPANPGRMYLCGKGIAPFKQKSPRAEEIAMVIRQGNDARAQAMVNQLAAWYASHGFETGLTTEKIAEVVGTQAGVPTEWVSLQERHIAQAFEAALANLGEAEKRAALEKLYGQPTAVDVNNPAALQGEIRSRLLKTGTPGFAPEVPLTFEEAYEYILEMDGIPVYPTLADGVSPICPFEVTADELAQRLLDRGIYAAELIPIRNTIAVVDEYVRAYTDAGLIVMAGTEHNTVDQIPLDPACVDGPVSDFAKEKFWEAACVVAAHQSLVANGQAGYVDVEGNRVGDSEHLQELIELGSRIINGQK